MKKTICCFLSAIAVMIFHLGLLGLCHAEAAHVHTWVQISEEMPTCVLDGSASYLCECGETKTEILPAVGHAYAWTYDADQHWKFCILCHETDESTRTEHHADCGDPTVCIDCGATAEIIRIRHENAWQSDETEHWLACVHCGEETMRGPHWAYCDAPDRCADCGAPMPDEIPVTHEKAAAEEYDADQDHHWFFCEACGNRIEEPHQYDENARCVICGYAEYAFLPDLPAEDAHAETEIERAAIESLEGETLPEDVKLIVSRISARPFESTGAKYCLMIALSDHDAAMRLNGPLRIRIPWKENVSGMRLMLLQSGGAPVEISYQYTGGELIFTTYELGVFIFAPDPLEGNGFPGK